MIGSIIGLILLCLVCGFLWWAMQQLIGLVSLSEPFPTIIRILLGLIILVIVIYAVQMLFGAAGIHVPFPSIK